MRARQLSQFSFALITLIALPFQAPAQDLSEKLAAIERAVDDKRLQLNIPGVGIAIVKDDKVIYSKGLGLRNVEERLPVTPKTQFAIGSSSKAFAAMTVMMCADDGKLALTDSPKKYLPYFKLSDPEADAKITIGDLLSHRSGLDRTDIAWYTGNLTSAREILQVAADAKPTAKLGARFQYQNVMFLAAGEVVAAAQKKPWRQVLAERIFRPLGMKTSNTDVLDMQQQPEFAYGYAWDAEKKQYIRLPAKQIRQIAPAGAINSNVEEMAQWVRLMLNGGVHNGKRLISEKSFEELTKPRISMGPGANYGYGWMLRQWGSHKVVEHGGNIDGFNALVALMPGQKLGFVMLTNVSASSLGSFMMDTVWEQLVGGGPKKRTVVRGIPTEPDREVGAYKMTGAPVTFDITMKDGTLVFTVAGQPPYPLIPLGGRRYKFDQPAPEGFFVTFRPHKDRPQVTELFLEQPQGNALATREVSTYTAPITVEELMKRVVDAGGGEANLRRLSALTLRYDLTAENQGITGKGVEHWSADGRHADNVTLYAAGKKIATMRECFDGKVGSAEVSFAASRLLTGKDLANAAVEANFTRDLDWQRLYKDVKIVKIDKVEGEDCYVVEKAVEKGDRFTECYSTKTFLRLKIEGPGGFSQTFKDYRDVGGIKVSFLREGNLGGLGNAKITVREVKIDPPISASAFRPRVRVPSTAPRPAVEWTLATAFE